MTVQIMASPDDVMRRSEQRLPNVIRDVMRQSTVVLEFAEPIPGHMMDHFRSIHFTVAQRAGGEEQFFQAELFQPHRAPYTACPDCSMPMLVTGRWASKCTNAACQMFGGVIEQGPVRGIVDVRTFTDWITHVEGDPPDDVQFVNAVVLILDRRYRTAVRFSLRNFAGDTVCARMGWRLL